MFELNQEARASTNLFSQVVQCFLVGEGKQLLKKKWKISWVSRALWITKGASVPPWVPQGDTANPKIYPTVTGLGRRPLCPKPSPGSLTGSGSRWGSPSPGSFPSIWMRSSTAVFLKLSDFNLQNEIHFLSQPSMHTHVCMFQKTILTHIKCTEL